MEEDQSWLSSVIDRVDKLALSIVGYEDDPPEYALDGFSDDESDSSSSEGEGSGDSGFEDAAENHDDDNNGDDSGFKDAIASRRLPSTRRPQAGNAGGHGKGGGSTKALQDRQHKLYSEWTPVVSSADKAPPPMSVTHPLSNQEHPDIDDARPSEEAPFGNSTPPARQQVETQAAPSSSDETPVVSVTPSHSQDRLNEEDMPDVEGAPSRQGGGADGGFIPVFCTPAHSRDRNASNQAPPVPALPAGNGGTGSRRAHRDRHRNGALGASSSAGMRRRTVEKPAPVHASPSASLPIKTAVVNRPPRSTGEKKFSYVSDNTWLKPKTDSPKAASSLLERREPAAAGERASIQTSPISTPAPEAPSEEAPALDSATVPKVGAADDTPSLTARTNQCQSLTEMKQQLEQSDEVKLDSRSGMVSEETLNNGAGDEDGAIHETGAKAEVIASECSEDSLEEDVPSQEQEHKADANGHGQDDPHGEDTANQVVMPNQNQAAGNFGEGLRREEAHAEEGHQDGVLQEGAVESPHLWAEGASTVGGKRASVENFSDAQDPGWLFDSPEGLAPSKRGKTQLKHPLAVMRHSVRLDDAIHERQRKRESMTSGRASEEGVAETESKDDRDEDELFAIPWPDKTQRPYDSPIVDEDLPAQQAKELNRLGMGSQTFILCSPFRRCLQTAGVVARTLGVASVTVHLEVGERMDKVRKEIAELTLANEPEPEDTVVSSRPAPVFSYLEEEGMREALGEGVRLERVVGEQPPQEESGIEAKQRFIATIGKVREEQLRYSPVLVVAHGDTLDAAGESLASQIVFEADYCAWAMFDLDTHSGYVTESYGIQMIPL